MGLGIDDPKALMRPQTPTKLPSCIETNLEWRKVYMPLCVPIDIGEVFSVDLWGI
jgi:hypothetical protein